MAHDEIMQTNGVTKVNKTMETQSNVELENEDEYKSLVADRMNDENERNYKSLKHRFGSSKKRTKRPKRAEIDNETGCNRRALRAIDGKYLKWNVIYIHNCKHRYI